MEVIAELPTRPTAGDALFRAHHAALRRWLGALERDEAVCEDVAAQAFVELLRIEQLGDIEHPRALLKTIARRLLCDRRRRAHVEQRYLADLARQPEPLARSAEDDMILREAWTGIGRALDGLSPNARAAFLYSQIDGLTYAEIGHRLGVSTSRVQQYMASGFRACAEAGRHDR